MTTIQGSAAVAVSTPPDQTEAHRTLVSFAHGRTGEIPEDLLVRHVLRVTHEAEWPVKRAAMEAALRRFAFAARDELRVAERPAGGRALGLYRTRRVGSKKRPYETLLEGIDPLAGSCDCPDFLKNSLGLCKHVLAVLDHLAARPRVFQQAVRGRGARAGAGGPTLVWDPVRPLAGPGDGLERVRRVNAAARRGRAAEIGRRFVEDREGNLVLRDAHADDPAKRLALVEVLMPLARRRPGRAAASAEPHPALRALLAQEKERLERLVECGAARPGLRRALATLRRKLYPFQVEGVDRALGAGRLLLADDMGLGKTAQATAVCHALWRTGRARRGLLIVPASLKPQWKREWELVSDAPVEIVEGGPGERRETYRRRDGFLIANYEQVIRDLEHITRWGPQLVVLDEAQRIKNWETKTAGCVKRLHPPYRLVLTGTPMENRLDELASILEWVDEGALEPRWRLGPVHTVFADGKRERIGARGLETLRARLAPSMVRRVRHEVLKQLPPRTDTVVPVELTEAQHEEHDALVRPIAALLRIMEKRPLTQEEFLKLMTLLTMQRIIANGLAQFHFEEQWPQISRVRRPSESFLRSLDSPKLLELREMIGQLAVGQGRKLVVFSQWRRMLQLVHWACADVLAEGGVRAAYFSGHEGQRQRTRNLVDFHDDPALRVFLATDAGGVGLNLQRASNCVINVDLPWNPAVLEQRIGRIYRIGQDHPIDVYNLVGQDCIEARIAGLVGDKKALFSALFDGTTDEVRFERSGSFLSTVARLVGPAPVPAPADDEEAEAEAALEPAIEEMPDASDEAPPVQAAETVELKPGARDVAPSPPAGRVRDLFASLSVRPTAGGGVAIEAPPEAAESLAALFEGMASLLRAGSPTAMR